MNKEDESRRQAKRWSFDENTDYKSLDLPDFGDEIKSTDLNSSEEPGRAEESKGRVHFLPGLTEPIFSRRRHGVFDDEREKDLPILQIGTRKGTVSLIVFTHAEGNRVSTSIEKNYGPEVAANSISLKSGEKTLVYKAGLGVVGLTLASVNPNHGFLLFEPNVLTAQVLERNISVNHKVQNASTADKSEIDDFVRQHKLSNVILETDRFSGFDTLDGDIKETQQLLCDGGFLYLITHKKAGGERHKEMLTKIYGNIAECIYKGRGGYRVYTVQNISHEYNDKKTERQVEFDILGLHIQALTEAGLFSINNLDSGTRFLLETTLSQPNIASFHRLLDLGCGWGAIGLSAALLNTNGKIVMTDVDIRAISVAKRNAQNLGISERAEIIASPNLRRDLTNKFDLVLSNPPFHIDIPKLRKLFTDVRDRIDKQGRVFIVVERSYKQKFFDIMYDVLGNVKIIAEGKRENGKYYYILSSRK